MRIAIAGGTGLIGSALAASLRQRGDEVLVLTRRVRDPQTQLAWEPDSGELPDEAALDRLDAVVNLAGTSVGGRWTAAHRTAIRASRLRATDLAARIVASQPGCALINGSAVGYYPLDAGVPMTEAHPPDSRFLAKVVLDWEAATAPAAGHRIVLARTGIVLAPKAPATQPLLLLGRLGLGGPLGSGKQYWPLITLVDEVRALIHLIDSPISGPVNLVAPMVVTQRELAVGIGEKLGRPAFLPAPAWAVRLGLGEFAAELLGSQLVVPQVLQADGFEFAHPSLGAALDWLLAD